MASLFHGTSYTGATAFPSYGSDDDRFERERGRKSSSPGTPVLPPQDGPSKPKAEASPTNSDDSSMFDLSDLSFVYEPNSSGKIVRVSKGSPKPTTPPTPSDTPPKAPSPPHLPSYSRPAPLARSESLPQDSLYAPRQFQRVTSGPAAATPAGIARGFSSLATAAGGTGRKTGPRRVRLEDLPEGEAQPKPNVQAGTGLIVDEKENQRAARIIRPARSVIGKSLGYERVTETNEEPEPPASAAPSHHPIRPRRSASLSDTPPHIDTAVDRVERPMGYHRAAPSLGARRVTLEEKIRQEREIALEEGYARREAEEIAAGGRSQASGSSPPHSQIPLRPHLKHQRRDSDTVRGDAGSPTAVESGPLRHRRSPTALEPQPGKLAQWPTMSEEQHHPPPQSKSKPPVQPMPPPLQPSKSSQSQTVIGGKSTHTYIVNKKAYARLDMIGKGGSSRVFRVMHSANGTHEIYALKRVPLDKIDSETVAGYMNEIRLLRRLSDNARIIRLIDSEVKQPSPNQKGNLMLVMELGEIDLAKLLYQQQKEPLDPVWIAYYWKQMLQAVHVIHEEKIVHSDLKPANFVLVRGQLKLIDFGIANAIANDTTNIQRDHQIGTVNYMSPEAIELPDGMRRLKVGRPSDVWSLGCILYQMVYGQPPFQALSVVHKMRAIPDEDHVIEYPEYAVPIVPRGQEPPPEEEEIKVRVPQSIINTMKSCLIRNPKARSTIPELLLQNWLEPEVPSVPAPPPPSPPPPPPVPTRELLLRDDETIINPHYMMQLLTYGLQLGWRREELSQEELMGKAESLVRELKQINIDTAR